MDSGKRTTPNTVHEEAQLIARVREVVALLDSARADYEAALADARAALHHAHFAGGLSYGRLGNAALLPRATVASMIGAHERRLRAE